MSRGMQFLITEREVRRDFDTPERMIKFIAWSGGQAEPIPGTGGFVLRYPSRCGPGWLQHLEPVSLDAPADALRERALKDVWRDQIDEAREQVKL